MKRTIFNCIIAFSIILSIKAQNPLEPKSVIDEFCSSFSAGINVSELESGNIVLNKYSCLNSTAGNIFNSGFTDAAAVFEETESGDGYRFAVIFKSTGQSQVVPEAFKFDLLSSLESGASGSSHFILEGGSPLTLVMMRGSNTGEIYTYEYDYNESWNRLELAKETWEEYDRFSESNGKKTSISYPLWLRPSLKTCSGGLRVTEYQYEGYLSVGDNYKVCLDQGSDMLGCAQNYYQAIDDLLNEEYQALRKLLNDNKKNELKSIQREWLKKRDAYFDVVEGEVMNSGIGGNDAQMMIWDKKAGYVLDRVVELMESQNKLNN